MKVTREEQLKIKLKGDDVETFKKLVKKLDESEKKVGFNNKPFNDDEVKLISSLNEKV
jgi:hypothetical protein